MLDALVLRDQFEALLDKEQQALTTYAALMDHVANPAVREHLEQLLREKRRHVELAERLLEIID